jgi:ribosomal protein S18 acetylase RimI-like enzyme
MVSPEIRSDTSAAGMLAANEANLRESVLSFKRLPDAELSDTGACVRLMTGLPAGFFNGVFLARLPARGLAELVRVAAAPFKERGIPFKWWLTSAEGRRRLGRQLKRHGLKRVSRTPAMGADLAHLKPIPSSPQNFEVGRVGNPGELAVWLQVLAPCFGLSDLETKAWNRAFTGMGFSSDAEWRNYVGYLDGRPAAVSSLFLGGGSAGIYNVATLPEMRRRGAGIVMTLVPLREASSEGYRVAVLQSSEMGRGIYRSLGFDEHGTFELFRWAPPSP